MMQKANLHQGAGADRYVRGLTRALSEEPYRRIGAVKPALQSKGGCAAGALRRPANAASTLVSAACPRAASTSVSLRPDRNPQGRQDVGVVHAHQQERPSKLPRTCSPTKPPASIFGGAEIAAPCLGRRVPRPARVLSKPPPSTQSVADTFTPTSFSAGKAARTASKASSG